VASVMFARAYSGVVGLSMTLTGVYVSPEYRQQGIASEIFRQIAAV